MNQLIKTQGKFILVSDEEIKEGEWMMFNSSSVPVQCTKNDGTTVYHKHGHYDTEGTLKIISENPDFSLLSEEDCKEIGWVDVEKLYPTNRKGSMWMPNVDELANQYRQEGFKSAQSLNEKQFSLEDMKKYHNIMCLYGNVKAEEFIQSLQQTVWNVEVEMDCVYQGKCVKERCLIHSCDEKQPKITDGSIKIIKIL